MNIIVQGKCSNVTLDGCKKVNVSVNAVINGVEVNRCNTVKISGIETLPFVNVEQSIETKIFLTHATKMCKVQTTCSRSLNIRFPKEGCSDQSQEDDDWKTQAIPEAFETKIDYVKDKAEIEPVDYDNN